MTITVLSLLLTYAISGFVGILASKRLKYPLGRLGKTLLVVVTVLCARILPEMRLIQIFQIEMDANLMLQGFFAGMLIGEFNKKPAPRTPDTTEPIS